MLVALAFAWAAALSAAQTPAASDAPPPGASRAEQNDVDIALVLPVEAAAYSRAADAVRSGFMAAAESASGRLRVRVFPHGEDGVLPVIRPCECGKRESGNPAAFRLGRP